LRQHGTPTNPQQISEHSVLHYSNISMRDEWSWLYAHSPQEPDLTYAFSSNNAEALRAMALGGMGITVLPDFIVEAALAQGSLVQIFKKLTPTPLPLYAVRPSRQFTPARVRAFIEFLQDSFKPQKRN
jgi:DNA-binding transcriptional LysR family regulator